MTCASCANRIERKLNKLDGVVATVNYATEKAQVSYPRPSRTADLLATVEAAGYAASAPGPEPERRRADDGRRALRSARLVVSAAAQRAGGGAGDGARPAVRRLAVGSRSRSPRRSCCGAPGPSTAPPWTNLRHGATTMDTLVSLGVLAAFAWSLVALFFGRRASRDDPRFELTVERADGSTTSTSRPRPG